MTRIGLAVWRTILEDVEFIEVLTNRNVSAKFKLDNAKDFEEGKEYTINLIIGLQSLGQTTNIVNWAKDAGSISITPPEDETIAILHCHSLQGIT